MEIQSTLDRVNIYNELYDEVLARVGDKVLALGLIQEAAKDRRMDVIGKREAGNVNSPVSTSGDEQRRDDEQGRRRAPRRGGASDRELHDGAGRQSSASGASSCASCPLSVAVARARVPAPHRCRCRRRERDNPSPSRGSVPT